MPTVQEIRDAIKTTMNGVAGIGIVHGYERYSKEQADFQTLFVTAAVLKGWTIRRTAKREISPARGRNNIENIWAIRGFMGFDDANASEQAFDDLIEDIGDAFRADETLGAVVSSTVVDGLAGIQLESSEPVMFAGVLCHSARLRLGTRHYLIT